MDTLHPLSNRISLVITEHSAKGLVIFETGSSDLQMEEIETPRSQSCAEGHTRQASAEVSTSGSGVVCPGERLDRWEVPHAAAGQ